jgi:hypothetical protein
VWCELLIKDCQLAPFVSYKRANGTSGLCVLKISKIVGIPFGVLVLVTHIAAGFDSAYSKPGLFVAVTMAPALALAVWVFHLMVYRATRRDAKDEAIGMLRADQISARTWQLVAFAASAVPSIIALLILETNLVSCNDWRMDVMLSICSVVVVAANIVVAISFATRRGWAALAAAVATVFLLVAGESLDGKMSLLNKIMASYGVGESTSYSVIVTGCGREMLEAQDMNVVEVSGGRGCLDDVAILSRLGDEFYFLQGKRKVRLAADMVTSWSRDESGARRRHCSAPAAAKVATKPPSGP